MIFGHAPRNLPLLFSAGRLRMARISVRWCQAYRGHVEFQLAVLHAAGVALRRLLSWEACTFQACAAQSAAAFQRRPAVNGVHRCHVAPDGRQRALSRALVLPPGGRR